MSTRITESSLWRFAIAFYDRVKKLKEFIGLVAFCVAVIGLPFGRPTLDVKYRLERIFPPVDAERRMKACAAQANSENDAAHALAGLLESRDLLRLTIQNNSSATIENVDLQIDGFHVADVALRSNSSRLMADREKLLAFDISPDFVIRFPNLTTIPPKAEVTMILWGHFNWFLLRAPVQVVSTAKSVQVVEEDSVFGLRLFVARHLFIITVFIAMGLLLLGLRRLR